VKTDVEGFGAFFVEILRGLLVGVTFKSFFGFSVDVLILLFIITYVYICIMYNLFYKNTIIK
jgi:hypothetical protein